MLVQKIPSFYTFTIRSHWDRNTCDTTNMKVPHSKNFVDISTICHEQTKTFSSSWLLLEMCVHAFSLDWNCHGLSTSPALQHELRERTCHLLRGLDSNCELDIDSWFWKCAFWLEGAFWLNGASIFWFGGTWVGGTTAFCFDGTQFWFGWGAWLFMLSTPCAILALWLDHSTPWYCVRMKFELKLYTYWTSWCAFWL